MLGNEIDIFCAGFFEQLRPAVGVEQFRLEIPGKVFVSFPGIDPVVECRYFRLAFLQLFRVPFRVVADTGERGNGIQPLMNKNAEFRVCKPLRNFSGV